MTRRCVRVLLASALALCLGANTRTRRSLRAGRARTMARVGTREAPGPEVSAALRQQRAQALCVDEFAHAGSDARERALQHRRRVVRRRERTAAGRRRYVAIERAHELGSRRRDESGRRPRLDLNRAAIPSRARSRGENAGQHFVPRQHGLLHLTVDGVAIPDPRQDGGTLLLGKSAAVPKCRAMR